MPSGRPSPSSTNSAVILRVLRISSAFAASRSLAWCAGSRHHVAHARGDEIGAHVAAQIAVGDDADQLAVAVDDADAAEALG
jgi:hypothetical protein